MKQWLQAFLVLSILCLFPAAASFAVSGSSTGPVRENNSKMEAPLAEMMFYEAAEQAVEDDYAEIIPESESKTGPEAVDTDNTQAGEDKTPSGTKPREKMNNQ